MTWPAIPGHMMLTVNFFDEVRRREGGRGK
jgi:hypothetical protein